MTDTLLQVHPGELPRYEWCATCGEPEGVGAEGLKGGLCHHSANNLENRYSRNRENL